MLLSVVIVGLVPYYSLNLDTPISSAFGDSGMQCAAYILTTEAITGLCPSLLGSLLAQVSVGTLAACVLVLRYVPPDGVPPPSSSQTWTDTDESRTETENFLVDAVESSDSPLLGNETARDDKYFGKRRNIAAWSIALVSIGVLGLASAASAEHLPRAGTWIKVLIWLLIGSMIYLFYG